jgi:hypothetical protein
VASWDQYHISRLFDESSLQTYTTIKMNLDRDHIKKHFPHFGMLTEHQFKKGIIDIGELRWSEHQLKIKGLKEDIEKMKLISFECGDLIFEDDVNKEKYTKVFERKLKEALEHPGKFDIDTPESDAVECKDLIYQEHRSGQSTKVALMVNINQSNVAGAILSGVLDKFRSVNKDILDLFT